MQTAIFGGGCFWCTEAVFSSLRGVISVVPGYAGGSIANPTYEQVSTGKTGHAEVSKIQFDEKQISFSDLLDVFFHTHDPTTKDRQGNDVGSQYRSVIFPTTDEQERISRQVIHDGEIQKEFSDPLVTTIEKLTTFFEAEDYHKKYYEHHKDAQYCSLVISPKLQKLRKKYGQLVAKTP